MIGNKQSLLPKFICMIGNKHIKYKKGFAPLEVQPRHWYDIRYKAKPTSSLNSGDTTSSVRPLTGFTLIEIMGSVVIFSVIVLIVTGIFISILRVQRVVLATQEILDQASYALEYMSRAMRMAKKDLTGVCLSDSGLNYELTSTGVKFIDYDNNCTEYYLENNQLKKRIGGDVAALTSQKLKVNYFKIILDGENQTDTKQPRVTFSFEIESQRLPLTQRPQLRFQAAISQRNLDIEY